MGLLERLYIGGDIMRPDRRQRQAVVVTPGEEPGASPRIGAPRIRVADVGGEEFDIAPAGGIAGGGDQRRIKKRQGPSRPNACATLRRGPGIRAARDLCSLATSVRAGMTSPSPYRIERDRGSKESRQQLAVLREKWPLAFPVKHQDVRPLAMGVARQVAAAMGWSLPYTLGVLGGWKMAPVLLSGRTLP
jgi:hypothetical protein